jgi:hypothetical protein
MDRLAFAWRTFPVRCQHLRLRVRSGSRCFNVVVDEGVDMGAQLLDGLERGVFERFSGDDLEPDLDLIQPGGESKAN